MAFYATLYGYITRIRRDGCSAFRQSHGGVFSSRAALAARILQGPKRGKKGGADDVVSC